MERVAPPRRTLVALVEAYGDAREDAGAAVGVGMLSSEAGARRQAKIVFAELCERIAEDYGRARAVVEAWTEGTDRERYRGPFRLTKALDRLAGLE